jgi:hypothetical protein
LKKEPRQPPPNKLAGFFMPGAIRGEVALVENGAELFPARNAINLGLREKAFADSLASAVRGGLPAYCGRNSLRRWGVALSADAGSSTIA